MPPSDRHWGWDTLVHKLITDRGQICGYFWLVLHNCKSVCSTRVHIRTKQWDYGSCMVWNVALNVCWIWLVSNFEGSAWNYIRVRFTVTLTLHWSKCNIQCNRLFLTRWNSIQKQCSNLLKLLSRVVWFNNFSKMLVWITPPSASNYQFQAYFIRESVSKHCSLTTSSHNTLWRNQIPFVLYLSTTYMGMGALGYYSTAEGLLTTMLHGDRLMISRRETWEYMYS